MALFSLWFDDYETEGRIRKARFSKPRGAQRLITCSVCGPVSLPVHRELTEGRGGVFNGGIPSTQHSDWPSAGTKYLTKGMDNLHRGFLETEKIQAKGSQRLGVEWMSRVPWGLSDHSKALSVSVLFITGTERGSSRSNRRAHRGV